MKVKALALLLLIVLYGVVMVPFTDHMRGRPFVEKLGYLPASDALRCLLPIRSSLLGLRSL